MAQWIGLMGMMLLALGGCAGTPMSIEQAERIAHGNDVAPADERLKLYTRYTNTIPNAYMKAALAKDPAKTAQFTDPGHPTRVGDGIMLGGLLLGLVDGALGYSIASAEILKGFDVDKNHFAIEYNSMVWGAAYLYYYGQGDTSRTAVNALHEDFGMIEGKTLSLAKEQGFGECQLYGYRDDLKYTQAQVQLYDGAFKYRVYVCGKMIINIRSVVNATHTSDTETVVYFQHMKPNQPDDAAIRKLYADMKEDLAKGANKSWPWQAIALSCSTCRNGADGLYAYAAGTELESPIPKPMPEI